MADRAKKRLGGLRNKQQFLYIGVFTLVAVMIWVAGSLFQSQRKTGISRELQLMAVPLNPNINTFAIDRIEQKTAYSDEELQDFEIFVINLEEQNITNSNQPAAEQPSLLPLTLTETNSDSSTSNATPPPIEIAPSTGL